MSDVHALVGAYAVDAVDDVERAAFERHLGSCQACRLELEGLRQTATLLGSSEPAVPSARLRDQVLAGIATVRPLPPVTTPAARAAETRRRRFRPATLVAAAAALIALGAGGVVWQQVTDDDSSQAPSVSAADRVLAAPDAEEYSQTLDDGSEVTVVRSRSLNRAVLVAEDLPPAPEGKVYELWLAHDDQGMVPAGLTSGQDEQVVFQGDAATAVGAGITIEPEGGSEKPTLPAVTTFAFEST